MTITFQYMFVASDAVFEPINRGANTITSLGGIIGEILLKFAISRVWGV